MKKLILLLAVVLFSCNSKTNVDLIVTGKIWTGNESQPIAEAMAISADTIVAIGALDEINNKYASSNSIKSPAGQLIVPGFIDTHTHFVDGGFRLSSVQLRDAKTPKEFIQRIKTYAATLPAGAWITGGDWDHENWGGELPDRNWVDSVTQDHPLWINRLDGHMSLANTAALKAAGIDDKVKDVDGGTIVRSKGRVTGIFKDNAIFYIDKVVPTPPDELEDRALDTAMAYVASKGVTSAHNMFGNMAALKRAHKADRLKTRIYAGMKLVEWKTLNDSVKAHGFGDKWLRFGNLKAFVDGSLGSHTAAFHKPFIDSPKDSGFFITAPEDLYKMIKSADSAGLHLMVHAIGDRAIHSLLDIFERVEKENGSLDRRFRIEHAQHIAPEDIPRFAQLGVVASMQPYHAIDDGRWAEKAIGAERSKTTYAFKSLFDANTIVSFGSDWFVAPPTPLEGIYAAVTRRTLDDKNPGGWVPGQKITVEQALKAYTLNAAYSSFEEDIKGSLAPGKLADFVILEKDLTSIDPAEIRSVKVLRTVVGGRTVFEEK
ncbi:MAG: amidohydrolase [Bacteroidota bacterium]